MDNFSISWFRDKEIPGSEEFWRELDELSWKVIRRWQAEEIQKWSIEDDDPEEIYIEGITTVNREIRERSRKHWRDHEDCHQIPEERFRIPVLVETDGACAGNCEKKSPGGWGAIVVQEKRACKLWGAKNDTSNNEVEYQAMLSALEIIPPGAYICFETDSQECIDGLTKHRRIWEKHRWHTMEGKPVENAELIERVGILCDQNVVGFRKVKGLSKDPWNDAADALAVNAVPISALPEKLVDSAPDAAFAPKSSPPKVPGNEGQEFTQQSIKLAAPRSIPSGSPSLLVLVQIEGELKREARIRPDYLITEMLGAAFKDEEFPKSDTLKFLKKPLKFEDGAVFNFERIQQIARLALEFQTWDNRLLRFGIEVSPRATMSEIFTAAQAKADEPLGNPFHYAVYSGEKIARGLGGVAGSGKIGAVCGSSSPARKPGS